MTDSYRAELRELIDRVYLGEFGGRATTQMVHGGVLGLLDDHLVDYLIGKGIASEVQAYFRVKGANGLPKFPEINEGGEHGQLELLTLEEFGFLHRRYLERADANTTQAEKVREMCLDNHGVDLRATEVAS